jgi:hypothetical protein
LYPSFLGDTPEEFNERMAKTNRLVLDVVESVIRQVGSKYASQLFEDAFKQKPGGKKPNSKRNAELMEAYRSEIASGTPRRLARLKAAKRCVKDWEDPQPAARQIRKLATAEKRDAELRAQWLAKIGPSFLNDPEDTF